ncbi:hypothetical protein TrCOL_g7799 [Triparma columacea]|uniref:Thioredoxin domain-containing protein n=1 Tax=Triparma columacea TaxID=722753 RepID=A0A9W7GHR1_9STRA|nr:hypothetical protein TrCOL_g7799 [Triparma columacea]
MKAFGLLTSTVLLATQTSAFTARAFSSPTATFLMSSNVGKTFPSGITLKEGQPDYASPLSFDLAELTSGKKVVILAVPGAFTPGCSKSHLPSFINNFDQLKSLGVDEVICTATNDAYTMYAWGVDQGCAGKVRMLSDSSGSLMNFLGTVKDDPIMKRSERYTLIAEGGKITHFFPGVGTDGQKTPENAWAPNVIEKGLEGAKV